MSYQSTAFDSEGNKSEEDDVLYIGGSSSEESDGELGNDSSSESDNNDSEDDDEDERVLAEKEQSLLEKMKIHADDLESDDEESKNTTGNVPLHWYDEYEHVGYKVDGTKVLKRNNAGDNLDNIVRRADDPNYKWTVIDERNDEEIVLTPRDIELLRRVQSGQVAHPEHNPYPEYVDYFTGNKNIHTLGADRPEPKRRFLPSKWEWMKVMKIAKGIKEGRIRFDTEKAKKEVYMLWGEDGKITGEDKWRGAPRALAPKLQLPGHAESYNPPSEYLPTEEEIKEWHEMDPSDRQLNFIPKKFSTLRHVPAYDQFIKERFERCLDLYLCPRVAKNRLDINPDSLIPKLPKPEELRPFPTTEAFEFCGHNKRIRSVSVDPSGQWLISGSDDGTIRLWEVSTGRCENIWNVEDIVYKVVWNPNPMYGVVAAAVGNRVIIIDTETASGTSIDSTEALLTGYRVPEVTVDTTDKTSDESSSANNRATVEWVDSKDSSLDQAETITETEITSDTVASEYTFSTSQRLTLIHKGDVKSIHWHQKGDYLASIVPELNNASIAIHQVSKRTSQNPFKKMQGQVQTVCFHPSKPFFFVATQKHVRVYHLMKQMLVKKLQSGAKWISSMAIHASGDHLIIGTYDKRLCWFDLDLSSTPYKTLKSHSKAIRSVGFHSNYPLMASASDDCTIQVYHSKVYSDLITNPLIVPVKILRGHSNVGGVGILDLIWHPTQPWLISSGADSKIRMYQNIP